MKTERLTRNPPPITPIRGRILGRIELLFVRDRKADGGHRRIVARYALPGDRRDVEIFAPTIDAAWSTACRVAKRERNKQRREELGNERAAKIQKRLEAEDRRKRDPGIRPEINLTIKREWLDAILFRGKDEEYRDLFNPQLRRLYEEQESVGHFPLRTIVAVLRAGYTMDARAFAFIVSGISRVDPMEKTKCVRVTTAGPTARPGSYVRALRPEWGEPETPHLALHVGHILKNGNYREVKEWLARHSFAAEGAEK